MKRSDQCEEIRVKALKYLKLNLKKRRFIDTVWKLNAPGDRLLAVMRNSEQTVYL